MTKQGCKMERIANNGNMQVADNKGNNFFYFPMISMACTGSGYHNPNRKPVNKIFTGFSFFNHQV
ncbi:MAG: hypothetical protein KAZ39_03080, partial [Parabacteroides sp.]|nr:hypothetical protein [Parabacteroides sp.]